MWAGRGAIPVVAALGVLAIPPGPAAAQTGPGPFPISAALPPEARQFDFWVGEWDVNLRVRQQDGSWADEIQSEAHIFPILNGKAVLELWNDSRQTGIKGYSLRYYDPAQDAWVLWLNWPSNNQSGSSSLRGSFRHGRGEFFAGGGGGPITRYTFSDITDTSLRWDDAVSRDNGATWSANWIMEFSRTGAKAALSPTGGPALTWHDGSRCDAPEFRRYEFLAGSRDGEGTGGAPVTIQGHQILDGCALITFAGPSGDAATLFERAWGFSQITWNARRGAYEMTTLTGGADEVMRVFYTRADEETAGDSGAGTPTELVFYEAGRGAALGAPVDRMRIGQTVEGEVIWAHETPDAEGGWATVWGAVVRY